MNSAQIPKEWRVDKSLPTPLFKQLAMNIRWSISTGQISPGEMLPPVRDLAQVLNLSVNTVRTAYKILEDERLVVARPKHGTEVIGVSAGMPPDRTAGPDIEEELFQTLFRAVSTGRSMEEVKFLVARVLERVESLSPGERIVFVECSAFDTENLSRQLSKELNVSVEPVVLDDLEAWLARSAPSLKSCRAIVTTFFHYANVLRVMHKYGIPVFGVVVENDSRTMELLSAAPSTSRYGVVCRPQDSTQYFLNKLRELGIADGQVRLAYVHEGDRLKDLLAWGDIFFVTQPCKPVVEQMAPTARIMFFYDRINSQSVTMLREYLEGSRSDATGEDRGDTVPAFDSPANGSRPVA